MGKGWSCAVHGIIGVWSFRQGRAGVVAFRGIGASIQGQDMGKEGLELCFSWNNWSLGPQTQGRAGAVPRGLG